ncbi:sugar ABC transporter permease [Paenibacillus sp. WQ 127069]|uniref:Sugar ABC transporter permease n=1 Tax=Paenibacillus baimaensis TaxID=2982185 RepID=A0ABT2URL0_9BACL|nr:sugar ABC transporter permease [Paenibacillus sp. WQ 127069]MCU6796452.1 sugar ABC transporter permease [Paenibacillus sp. WQ 127069]
MDSANRKWLPSKEAFQYFYMIIPALVLFSIFLFYPVLGGIYYSLTDWNGVDPGYHFIGFQNYVTFFTDFYVLTPLKNSFIFAFVLTIVQNVVSLVLALALNKKLKTKNMLRTVIFIPVLLSSLMVGYLWNYLFTEPIALLGQLLHIEVMGNNLLGSANTALYAAVFVSVWKMAGWNMVIYIAALQGIPTEIYEASELDGATGWKKFRYITFPLIAPAFTVNMVLTLERGFKEFDLLFSLTQGGPGNSSEIISLTIYRESFEYFRAGYGTTMGVILFLIIIIITLIQLKFLRKREEDVIY